MSDYVLLPPSVALRRDRTFRRTALLALLARVPPSAMALLLVLATRRAGHSYGVAGACSGTFALGMAAGAPVVGRLMDRFGQSRLLLGTAAVTTLATAAWVGLTGAPGAVLVVLAAVVGLAQPPVAACARAIWHGAMSERRFDAAVSLDATLQELAFMAGPLLLVGLATRLGPGPALAVTAVALSVITVAFARLPETRRGGGGGSEAASSGVRGGALRARGVQTIVIASVALGLAFGASEIGLVVAADHLGHARLTGVLFAFWGMGSLAAGTILVRRPSRHTALHRLTWLFGALAAGTAVVALSATFVELALALTLAGGAVAPLFSVLYSALGSVAPAGTLTEAFTLESSGLMVGIAGGSALGGVMAGAAGPSASFALGTVAAIAGATIVTIRGLEPSPPARAQTRLSPAAATAGSASAR